MIKIYCFFDILFSFGWISNAHDTHTLTHVPSVRCSISLAISCVLHIALWEWRRTCRMSIWPMAERTMTKNTNYLLLRQPCNGTIRFGEYTFRNCFCALETQWIFGICKIRIHTRLNGWKYLIDLSELVKSLETNRSIYKASKARHHSFTTTASERRRTFRILFRLSLFFHYLSSRIYIYSPCVFPQV